MFDTILTALLPITVVLLLGYLAGRHQDFTKEQAGILNKMVMHYALPLSLFSNIATNSISEILKQKEVLFGLFIGMIGFYLVSLFVIRYIFQKSLQISAIIALAISAPAIPFVGTPVLKEFYGPISSVPVAVGCIYINLFLAPMTIVLLNFGKSGESNNRSHFLGNIANAVKQPVVWAPVLGFIFLLLDLKLPKALLGSFSLLGNSSGGVALFASGIILYSNKVVLNRMVGAIVFSKNILIPLATWGVALALNFESSLLKETVITMSIPTASIAILLSIQYEEEQSVISSVLFISSVLSILTMGIFILLLG